MNIPYNICSLLWFHYSDFTQSDNLSKPKMSDTVSTWESWSLFLKVLCQWINLSGPKKTCNETMRHHRRSNILWEPENKLLKNENNSKFCGNSLLIFHQKKAFKKLWRMLFILPKMLISLWRYSNFCNFPLSCAMV